MAEVGSGPADPKRAPSTKSAAAFRTISEVATDLEVPPHVLRFWESKFPQIRPLKRGGGRRYYRPEDVDLLRRIRVLLYRDGYTIKGVQKLLRSPEGRLEDAPEPEAPPEPTERPLPLPTPARHAAEIEPGLSARAREILDEVIDELEDIRNLLAGRRGGG